MRILLMIPALLLASACNLVGQGSCETLELAICDQCDVSDRDKDTTCACLEDGEVDNVDDYFEDDDAAERWCWRLKNSLKATYNTNEDAAYCRSELVFLEEYGDDACDDRGWSDGGGYSYYY